MTLVARRPKGTERSLLRWFELVIPTAKPARYELRCVSTPEPYVVESFPEARAASLEAFAADVLDLAQEDCDARGERAEFHLVALGDDGAEGVLDDRRPLATHVIRRLPREDREEPPATDAALRTITEHQQVLLKSYLSLATTALAEVQRVSSTAIEATRGLVVPLARRVEALEAENADLRATAREAEQVMALASAEEEGSERSERRTQSLEKLAGAVVGILAREDPKLALMIDGLTGGPPKKPEPKK